MDEFKVGDKVVLFKSLDMEIKEERDWHIAHTWIDEMNNHIGKTFTIKRIIGDNRLKLEEDEENFIWPLFCFKLVDDKYEKYRKLTLALKGLK